MNATIALAIWSGVVGGLTIAGYANRTPPATPWQRQLVYVWATNLGCVVAAWWLAGFEVWQAIVWGTLSAGLSIFTAAAYGLAALRVWSRFRSLTLGLIAAVGGLAFVIASLFVLRV